MSQLLIIDVQNTYLSHIEEKLIKQIPNFSKNFSEVLYLFDNINGQNFEEEILDSWIEDDNFYERLVVISKEYAFFRSLIGKTCKIYEKTQHY